MDIYFEPKYGKLYEQIENGTSEVFNLTTPYGTIHHMFIKREISLKIDNEKYFDLVTPYGYGGPLITNYKNGYKKELIKEFEVKFKKFCEENNIVSEFVRFHPIITNAPDFKNIYTIEKIRRTVGTNIKAHEDPIASEFSKSTRKTIRRALKSGLSYRVIEKPNNCDDFKKIYYSTMDRNAASDYYYFNEDYFDRCLEYFRDYIIIVEVLYDEEVIAAGFYFVYNNIIHAHLSGTLNDYLNLSPAYIIKYATVQWAKENGIELIHYGGGTSNKPDDSLYQFKKKFGKNTEFDFYIGKRIWNMNIYRELCKRTGVNMNSDFFPAYRNQSI